MSATAGAPNTLEELKNVLKDDIKVKVAGEYRLKYGLALGLMLSRNRR